MSAIDPLHPTLSAVLETLGSTPRLTIEELEQHIKKEHGAKLSTSSLYRLVAQLIEQQVLVREKGKLSLNLVWVHHLLRMSKNIESVYLAKEHQVFDLPEKEGEQREFTADSLLGLDPAWNHILLQLIEQTDRSQWYEYASHPWFLLATPDTEVEVYRSITDQKIPVQLLVGNESYLDTYGVKMLNKLLPSVKARATDEPPFFKEGYQCIVYGAYIIECTFTDVISRHFGLFFESVHSTDQFDPQMFADVLRMKTHAKITVRKSVRDAKDMKKKFAKYF